MRRRPRELLPWCGAGELHSERTATGRLVAVPFAADLLAAHAGTVAAGAGTSSP